MERKAIQTEGESHLRSLQIGHNHRNMVCLTGLLPPSKCLCLGVCLLDTCFTSLRSVFAAPHVVPIPLDQFYLSPLRGQRSLLYCDLVQPGVGIAKPWRLVM